MAEPTRTAPTRTAPIAGPGPAGPGYAERVVGLLDGSAGLSPDRPVVEDGDRVVTAAELLDLVARISTGLRAAGVGPGDGLAVVLGVTPEAYAAILAAHVVGARVAGTGPALAPALLARAVARDAVAVLVDPSTASPAVREAAGPARLLAIGPVAGLADLTAVRADTGPLRFTARPDDVARIIYTSGSTGTPKGCEQTYRALAAGWAANPAAWPPAIRELAAHLHRYLVFGSLTSQVMAEYGLLTLAAGGTMVVARSRPEFPEAFARYRAGASVITVPRLYRAVAAQRAHPADLTTLRALMVSGSPLDPRRLEDALAVLGPVVFHGYGQTETGMISMVPPSEMLASPEALDSVGRPPAAVSVEIRDADGAVLPDGETGELFVRTPAQASGYRDDPAETAAVFTGGWVRTRDLARRDRDGRLHLLGRTRDVVIVNAVLVHAGPVERVLAAHPGIAEAYVVGAPSEETGEAVHAFVVPTRRPLPDPALLRALVAERLGPDAAPVTVTAVDEVPVTAAGKPDKQALRSRLPGPTTDARST